MYFIDWLFSFVTEILDIEVIFDPEIQSFFPYKVASTKAKKTSKWFKFIKIANFVQTKQAKERKLTAKHIEELMQREQMKQYKSAKTANELKQRTKASIKLMTVIGSIILLSTALLTVYYAHFGYLAQTGLYS